MASALRRSGRLRPSLISSGRHSAPSTPAGRRQSGVERDCSTPQTRFSRFRALDAFGRRLVKGIQRHPNIVLTARLRNLRCSTFGNRPSVCPCDDPPHSLRLLVPSFCKSPEHCPQALGRTIFSSSSHVLLGRLEPCSRGDRSCVRSRLALFLRRAATITDRITDRNEFGAAAAFDPANLQICDQLVADRSQDRVTPMCKRSAQIAPSDWALLQNPPKHPLPEGGGGRRPFLSRFRLSEPDRQP